MHSKNRTQNSRDKMVFKRKIIGKLQYAFEVALIA